MKLLLLDDELRTMSYYLYTLIVLNGSYFKICNASVLDLQL